MKTSHILHVFLGRHATAGQADDDKSRNLNEAGLKPKAKWLLLEGGDAAAMTRSLPLAKALDDVLIATFQIAIPPSANPVANF